MYYTGPPLTPVPAHVRRSLVQASTVQILGAEKALFRALKTKHETPKYGLIYHASLIGQASPKNKVQVLPRCAACGVKPVSGSIPLSSTCFL